MSVIIPEKLKNGDTVGVIAPSTSFSAISKEVREIAESRFHEMGLKVLFGNHVEEENEFRSSSIDSRIDDLHEAFGNTDIKAIFPVIGGFNSNQLLRYIDWDLIQNNPKIFCGYSDISALQNAIFAKTGLVTYSSPVYSTFGQKLYFEYTLKYFKMCMFENNQYFIEPSADWTDDAWYINQDDRHPIKNEGYRMLNAGEAEGTIIGANLCTFILLHGTEYMPSLQETILFLEDDELTTAQIFDRNLQSLIHQRDFTGVKGLVIGRFQKKSGIDDEKLKKIIKSKKELDNIPVIADADFGHTSPIFSFPIGGTARVSAGNKGTNIEIIAF